MATFNVKTGYGALGDGSTDDTAAIQSAVTALVAAGGTNILLFPVGTYIVKPVGAGLYTLPSNTTVQGVVNGQGATPTSILKVKAATGNWNGMFLTAVNADSVTVDSMGFDCNTAGNTTALINANTVATYQTFVYFSSGTNLTVTNCKFTTCGVWAVSIGSSIDTATVSWNTVVQQMYGSNGQTDYDNSSFYLDGTNYKVLHNTFTAAVLGFTRAAIECHGGATLTGGGAECAYNKVTGYQTLVNIVNGYLAVSGQRSDINVHDNTCIDAQQAIRIQPYVQSVGGGGTTTSIIGCTITNNIIGLSPLKYTYINGNPNPVSAIEVIFDGATFGTMSQLTITNNRITGQQDDNVSTFQSAYTTVGISLHNYGVSQSAPTNPVDTYTISGNIITLLQTEGIRIGLLEPGARDYSNGTITGNIIQNCGSSAAFNANGSFYSCGIHILDSASNLVCTNNQINDTFAVQRLGYGIITESAAAKGSTIIGNTFGRPTS